MPLPFIFPALANGHPVIISELAFPFRTLLLAGRDRPEQPVTRTTVQRARKSHYPGTNQASVQVMGSAEEPIVLRGWFHDPLTLLDGGPQARIAVARGILQGGRLCRLSWGGVITCKGRITRVTPGFYKAQRLRYEIEFDVDQPNEAVALTPLPIVAAVAQDLKAGLDQVLRAVEVGRDVSGGVKAIGAYT